MNDIRETALKKRRGERSACQKAQVSILREWIDSDAKENVLEIGCGYGFFTEAIASLKSVRHLYAIDSAKDIITPSVLEKYPKIRFMTASAVNLNYEDEFFDCVYSMDCIEHVEDDVSFINEGLRVLKRGGDLIIGTPNRNRLSASILKLIGKKITYPYYLGNDRYYGDIIHIREYSKDTLIDLLNKNEVRCEIQKIKGLTLGVLNVFELNRFPKKLEDYAQFLLIKAKKL